MHPTDDDHVVAGLVLRLDRAVEVRVHVVEDRAPRPDPPFDLTEPVDAPRREELRDLLLVLVEHVDGEVAGASGCAATCSRSWPRRTARAAGRATPT